MSGIGEPRNYVAIEASGRIGSIQPVQFLYAKNEGEWPKRPLKEDVRFRAWKPVPFRQFVVKVHSRCNLACDYCYIYEMGDTTWMLQPPSMSVEVARQAALRIAEHARRHSIERVEIVLHGGEPCLLGERRLRALLEIFERALDSVTLPVFSMQTNGVLLTDAMLKMLNDFDVNIGFSLDGGRVANDKHRLHRDGAGTYNDVVGRICALRNSEYSRMFTGILATIDVTNDPLQVYGDIRALGPPSMDLLLPHGNWTELPPFIELDAASTPYADWLIPIFDYWFASSEPEPSIRLFDQIIRRIFHEPSQSELIGISSVSLATIESDGSYELVDTMKSVFDGAARTGKNVFDNALDSLMGEPSVASRQIGMQALCDVCRKCDVASICGAGYYPHRYSRGSGFLHPSVFCRDLYKLITHIETVIEECA